MARLWALVSGGAAGLVTYGLLTRRRRRAPEPPPEVPQEPDPRAEELKAKLAEQREDEPEPEPQNVESRRQDVHENARSAIDEMRGEN